MDTQGEHVVVRLKKAAGEGGAAAFFELATKSSPSVFAPCSDLNRYREQ